MKRTALLAVCLSLLALVSVSAQTYFLRDAQTLNGVSFNETTVNGVALNGTSMNGTSMNGVDADDVTPVVVVRAVTLSDGAHLSVAP